ncbi:MAG: HAMP domain-containing protein [Candidatus Obscuribacterales bacterium]|nr:HAMP domain-containing protein [Candidatus Obscuribacterales bacterium]
MAEKGVLSDLRSNFANLKLSTKLSLSFGMVFLAFISVIITASLTLSELSVYQQDSFVRDLPATEGMATLSVNMRRMKTAVQMFILLEDPTGKDKAIAEIEAVTKENTEIVEQLKEIFQNDREMSDLLMSIERRLDNFDKRIKCVFIPAGCQTKDLAVKTSTLRDERENVNQMEALANELKDLTTKYAAAQTARAKEQAHHSIGVLWTVCILGVATSLALVVMLSRMTIAPLAQLTEAARQLEQSKSAVTVKDDGRTDEVGTLARTFNSMVRAIEEREAERDKALDRLEVSNAELKQFAYVAAHDLKEPLRTISNYLSLLGERLEGKLDEKGERFWKTVVESSYRMDSLITGLLTYAKLGNKALTPQPVDMNEVVSKVVGDLKVVVSESGAKVERHNLPLVYADGSQMGQLLQNLVANGIKFRGGQAPQVDIGANRVSNGWMFYVRDNGIGFDMQFQDRIFLIFQRLHGRDEYAGTGLGLAVCKRIVERHGGKIWAESKEGEGSTFFFTLPDDLQNHSLNGNGKVDESDK